MTEKAVIFDLDGLLIDSEPLWKQAHINVLARYGYLVSKEDMNDMAGRGHRAQVEKWQRRFGWTDLSFTDNLIAEIESYGTDLVVREASLKPGAQSLVANLYDFAVPLAVASGSPIEAIHSILRHVELDRYFTVVKSAKDEARPKPAPDVFLAAAKQLQVPSQDCVVIEDAAAGIQAAQAAGMRSIAVPEAPFDPARFTGADRVVDSLQELTVESVLNI